MAKVSSWVERMLRRRCAAGVVGKAKQRRAIRTRRVLFEPLEDRRLLATIVVTSLADNMDVDGEVTLREAIHAANTNTSVDGSVAGEPGTVINEIVFQSGLTGTIDLNGTELTVTGRLRITGPGREFLTIDAHQLSRHFHVTSTLGSFVNASLILDGVTLTSGSVTGNGGAILSDSVVSSVTDVVSLINTVVRNNSAVDGGAIYATSGNVVLTASSVVANQASGSGGGIYGAARITDSTISGNSAAVSGGGIQGANVANVHLTNSTISDNEAGVTGGGIGVTGGAYVNWSTVVENRVLATDGQGGGIYRGTDAVFGQLAYLALTGSIVARNTAAVAPDLNVPTPVLTFRYNLIGNNAETFLASGNLVGEPGALLDPLLAPLANYGGPTETHALLPGSPAIDAGFTPPFPGAGGTPPYDQRGFPRVEGRTTDIGAFELTQPLNFFDDGIVALQANNPSGFVEPPVPVFHNGTEVGTQPYQAIELYHLVPGTASYPLVFADLVGNMFSRLAYMRADGAAVNLGTSTVGSASFRTDDQVFHYVPTVTRADVTTGGASRYRSVVTANFGGRAQVTSTKSFLTPVVGQSSSTVAVQFEALQDISLATRSPCTTPHRLRLFTASSMFNDETHFDADVLRYEDANGNIQTLVLKDITPTNAYLFPTAVEIGSWFELVKTGGSEWFPDSPTIHVAITDKHGLRLGLQGYLLQSEDNNDDSLSVWLEWLDAPSSVTDGTQLNLDVTVTATPPGTPGIVVSETNGATVVSEAETTDTITVALAAQPRSNVVVNVNSSNSAEATVDPATLTFTPANWDQPQSVTVTGVPDAQIDGDQISTLTLQINQVASDIAYQSVSSSTVSVTTIDIDQPESPEISWNDPADITYGTLLDNTQLNATAGVPGTFIYSPASGALLNAGSAQQLSVTFTPDDTIRFAPVTAFVSINVLKAEPAITWNNPADIAFGTALNDVQLNATASVAGTFSYTPASGTLLGVGNNQELTLLFTPDDATNYNTAAATVTINVQKADPVIVWVNPADISYGELLGDAELNAASTVFGEFIYNPPLGALLGAGAEQQLSVSFVPTDTANYNPVTVNVLINVTQAIPDIRWNDPAGIGFGTPLSDTQLNASANIDGAFVYSPPAGIRLDAGAAQTLQVTFTPTDTVNFQSVVKTVKISVAQAESFITWDVPADITYGTLLSDLQLNATGDRPGSYVYTPALGTKLNAGSSQPLNVTFTPGDPNFASATAVRLINVLKVIPVVTWNRPADITFGTSLGDMQLTATTDIPGSFTYTPPPGTILDAGANQQLSVTFIPDDATNFDTVTTDVEITVVAINLDFGDAPSVYPVTLAQDGARHTIGSLYLGSSVDAEADGQPTSDATGDGTDDDGVFLVTSMVATTESATTSSLAILSSEAGKLDAWIDFNQDGDWNDVGEQIFTNQEVAGGLNLLSFIVPAGATPGGTFARFRLSSAGGLAPTGAAADGEVEDYMVTILDGDTVGGVAINVRPSASGMLDVFADDDEVVIVHGAIELFRTRGTSLSRIELFGHDGDDAWKIANLDAIFAGLVKIDAGDGSNSLRLTGSGQALDLADVRNVATLDITGDGDNMLTLDINKVINTSSTADALRVKYDGGDVVNLGPGWSVQPPQIVAGEFVHILTQFGATLELANTVPFQNPNHFLDVNRDGTISPLDVLVIVNWLNGGGPRSLVTPGSATLADFFYIDVNGDGSVSPVDVLQVINYLNNPNSTAEGESAAFSKVPDFSTASNRSTAAGDESQVRRRAGGGVLPFALPTNVHPVSPVQIAGSKAKGVHGARHESCTERADLAEAIDAIFSTFLD